MRLEGNLPFVTVGIGGRKCQFLVDSGASDCVITPEMARSMGLYVSKTKAMVKSAAGDRVPIPMTLVPVMSIGNAEFHHVPAFVFDFDRIRGNFSRMDGVIGFSMFRDATLTLDYPGQRMTITPGSLLNPKDPACVSMKTASGVPKIPLHGGPNTVFIDVDSGSTGGLEVDPDKLGVQTDAPPRPGGLSASIGKNYRTGMARVLGSLHLGNVEMADPIVEVTKGDFRVGGEVLQSTVISFDSPSSLASVAFGKSDVFRFRPSKRKLVSPSRIGTGIGFDDSWVVQDVVPESPGAQSGVKLGDRCIAVQGQPTKDMIDSYQTLLQAHPILAYTFQRGSKIFQVSVPVVLQVR